MIFTLPGTFHTGGHVSPWYSTTIILQLEPTILQQRERWFPRRAASTDLHQSQRDGLAPYNVCCRIVRHRALQCDANPADPAVTLYQLNNMCIWDQPRCVYGTPAALDESDTAPGPWLLYPCLALCLAGDGLLLMSMEANCKH